MIKAKRFYAVLAYIRERHTTAAEFPSLPRERFLQGVGERVMATPEKQRATLADTITVRELEALLAEYTTLQPKARTAASDILARRMTGRLWRLLWSMLLVCERESSLWGLADILFAAGEVKGCMPREAAYWRSFGRSGDPEAGFFSCDEDMTVFFETYFVRQGTPFATHLRLTLLAKAEPQVLRKNARHLCILVEELPLSLLLPVLEHYLMALAPEEALPTVHAAMLMRMGEPGESEVWNGFLPAAQARFAQWCFLNRLRLFSQSFPKKYEVLSIYYSKVCRCYLTQDGAMLVMDMGSFVLVDEKERPFSLYCEKTVFARESEENLGALAREANVSAREVILEGENTDYVRLKYEGVDVLYTKEFLEAQTERAPDLSRQS